MYTYVAVHVQNITVQDTDMWSLHEVHSRFMQEGLVLLEIASFHTVICASPDWLIEQCAA